MGLHRPVLLYGRVSGGAGRDFTQGHRPVPPSICRTSPICAAKPPPMPRSKSGTIPSRVPQPERHSSPASAVTVYPCLMGYGLSWDFCRLPNFFGVYYEALTNLIQKYSDQSASLVSRLKSIGDKSRLEILRSLKAGECNGQDISESWAWPRHHFPPHESPDQRGLRHHHQAGHQHLLHPESPYPAPLPPGAGPLSPVNSYMRSRASSF